MNTMKVTCGICCGIGKLKSWFEICEGTLQCKEAVCDQCGGNGYTEYAVFSVEEANAILKHCGLIKED